MKAETESAVRNVLAIDGEIEESVVEWAMTILRGEADAKKPTLQVMKRAVVMKLLGIHRRTLDHYLKMGYLDRVYGGGRKKAIGVSRESFLRFTATRVGRCAS